MPSYNGESFVYIFRWLCKNQIQWKFRCWFFISVKVKWGRESFPNIPVNTDDEPLVFKAQLFALTGVQPHRQKIMCKGVALKDDDWNFTLKDVCFWILLEFLNDLEKEYFSLDAWHLFYCPFLGSVNIIAWYTRWTNWCRTSWTTQIHWRHEWIGTRICRMYSQTNSIWTKLINEFLCYLLTKDTRLFIWSCRMCVLNENFIFHNFS